MVSCYIFEVSCRETPLDARALNEGVNLTSSRVRGLTALAGRRSETELHVSDMRYYSRSAVSRAMRVYMVQDMYGACILHHHISSRTKS